MAEEGLPARPPAFLLEMQRLTQEQEEEMLMANSTQSVEFSVDELDEAREPWKWSMVGKLIGKRVKGDMLLNNLRAQWKDVQSGFEMISMEEDYFVFRFNNQQDMQNVWRGSPWLVGDHPLALEEWMPDFRPSSHISPKVAVWVRLPNLPVEYWNSKLLLKICAAAGTPLWLDSGTAEMARACVLVDSEKPLAPGVVVGRKAKEGGAVGTRGIKCFWQQFVYEVVYDCCFRCGRIGHRDSDCANLPSLPLPILEDSCGTKNPLYGPWLTTRMVNRQIVEAVAPLEAKPCAPTDELKQFETATKDDCQWVRRVDGESNEAYKERHEEEVVVKYSIIDQLYRVLSLKKPTKQTPSFIPLTPLTALQSSSSSDRLDDCKRLFNNFDADHDGMISSSELLTFLRAVGQELSPEDAEAAVRSTDSHGDGLLCFEDFVKLANAEKVEAEDDESLKEAFKVYEMEGEGCITPDSLRRALDRLGIETTIEECMSMIREYDNNGDGVICFDEFKVMML